MDFYCVSCSSKRDFSTIEAALVAGWNLAGQDRRVIGVGHLCRVCDRIEKLEGEQSLHTDSLAGCATRLDVVEAKQSLPLTWDELGSARPYVNGMQSKLDEANATIRELTDKNAAQLERIKELERVKDLMKGNISDARDVLDGWNVK